MIKQVFKRALNRFGYDIHRQVPAAPAWTPPDPALLPDHHLYNPRFSPWLATEGEFHELCERIRPYTLVSRDRCYILRTLARQAAHCAGEFWECGVYKGGTAMLLKQTLSACPEPPVLRLFDTFEGLPEADPMRDFHRRGEFADTSAGEVAARVAGVAAAGSDSPNASSQPRDSNGAGSDAHDATRRDRADVRIHAGLIPATFNGLEDCRIAFAHVDVDLHDSVRDCCDFIYPRLAPGGVMVFDDYGLRYCPGARRAVDAFFADKPESVLVLPTGQALVTALPAPDAARAGAVPRSIASVMTGAATGAGLSLASIAAWLHDALCAPLAAELLILA